MKNCRRYISLIACFVLCFTMLSSNVDAKEADYGIGDIVDGSLLTNDRESTGTMQHLGRGTYYSSGVSGISDYGNGLIYVDATTYCNRTCNQIGLTIYVERLVNNMWVCISEKSYSTTNDYYLSGSYDLVVSRGYFYRVRAYHTAGNNVVTESGWSQTKGLLIS